MAFGSIGNSNQTQLFDIGAALVRTAQQGARPAFELNFYNTQNAQLDALDRDIEKIRLESNTSGATALLKTKITGLERSLGQISDYKERTDARIAKSTLIIEQLNDLGNLADPSSVAEFDAKLAQLIDTVNKTEARSYEYFGVNDKVRKHKADALASLNSLSHNGFATQQDIDDVNATLSAIRSDFMSSNQIANTNANLAFTQYTSTSRQLNEIRGQMSAITIDAKAEVFGKIEERKRYYSEILTVLSLAFEASQNLTNFVGDSLQPKKIDKGSVLNLFS
jgi:small-conductance mechanosensitive channel